MHYPSLAYLKCLASQRPALRTRHRVCPPVLLTVTGKRMLPLCTWEEWQIAFRELVQICLVCCLTRRASLLLHPFAFAGTKSFIHKQSPRPCYPHVVSRLTFHWQVSALEQKGQCRDWSVGTSSEAIRVSASPSPHIHIEPRMSWA